MSASPSRAAEGFRLASRIIALMMSIATAGLLVKVADLSAGLSSFLVIVLVWCLSPYARLALALRRPWKSTEAVLVAFATTIAVSGFALYIYTVAFFVKPDAQSGLVFLFIPLWQWIGALAGLGVAWLIGRRKPMPGAKGQ
jgi:hypothetical protein